MYIHLYYKSYKFYIYTLYIYFTCFIYCLEIMNDVIMWCNSLLLSLSLSYLPLSMCFIDLLFVQIVIFAFRFNHDFNCKIYHVCRGIKKMLRQEWRRVIETAINLWRQNIDDIKSIERRSFNIVSETPHVPFLRALLLQNPCLNLTFAVPLNELYWVCRDFAERVYRRKGREKGKPGRIIFRFSSIFSFRFFLRVFSKYIYD